MPSPTFRFSAAPGWKRLFSQDCQLCGCRAVDSLCPACVHELPFRLGAGCPQCAAEGADNQLCGGCLAHPPAFDRTVAVFRYAFPLDRLLQSYKFRQNLALTSLFAGALNAAVSRQPARPDTLIAVPLARARLAERGFNQSALLAESLARAMQIDFATHGLLKIRDTLPQAGLNRAARLKNVRGAFDCARSLAGRHVALVDDVMTTGATLSEAAKALKKAGAASVSAWVLARAGREWAMPPAQNDPDLPDIAIPF